MGIFDFFNKNKKERERQEQLRKQQEAEAKRKAEEQRRLADAQHREEERKRQEQSKKEEEILSDFDFDSNCHQRYEGGNAVMGLQVCPRHLKIRKNINGCSGYQLKPGDGYILSATNGDTGKPQFAPKPMRVIKFTDDEILLKGYTVSAQTPFGWQEIDMSDYGFSILLRNGKPEKCELHMYDRNVKLVYMNKQQQQEEKKEAALTETEKYVIEAVMQLSKGHDGDETYHPLYKAWRSFRSDPSQLHRIQDYGRFGMGLMIFLSYNTVSDIDDQQQLASVAYLFISKAIKESPSIVTHYKNRLILMISYQEAFGYTVSSVVGGNDLFSMSMFPFEARDAMYKMEFADLSSNNALLNIDILGSKYREIKDKISSGFFGDKETSNSIIENGKNLHNKVLAYLEKKVLDEGDVDF